MRLPEDITASLDALKTAGFEPWIEQGKHYKLKWLDSNGHEHTLVMARSPSDWRATKNSAARLKRKIAALQPLPIPLPE